MRAVRRSAAVVVASALLLGASAAPASAEDGLWYYQQMGIDTAHADGVTGEGVTIAVIDGPINTDVPTLQNANIEVREDSFCTTGPESTDILPARSTEIVGQLDARHGTNVASFIVGTGDGYDGQTGVKGVAPGAKLLYYTAWTGDPTAGGSAISCYTDDFVDEEFDSTDLSDNTAISVGMAMNEAMDAGADVISISALITPASTDEMFPALVRAVREGVVVVGGLSNTNAVEFTGGWPGLANGAVAVQAMDSTGTIQQTGGLPNTSYKVTVIAPGIGLLLQGVADGAWEEQRIGSGTSYATPMVAGFLALVKQKYPDTTGNQLIQTLIRNTGTEDHELYYDPADEIGFGVASASHMLRVDPSQYADENPLIVDDAGVSPTRAEFAAAPEPSADPAEPADPQQESGSGSVDLLPIIIGIIVGFVVLVGVIVLVVVLVVRGSKKKNSTSGIQG